MEAASVDSRLGTLPLVEAADIRHDKMRFERERVARREASENTRIAAWRTVLCRVRDYFAYLRPARCLLGGRGTPEDGRPQSAALQKGDVSPLAAAVSVGGLVPLAGNGGLGLAAGPRQEYPTSPSCAPPGGSSGMSSAESPGESRAIQAAAEERGPSVEARRRSRSGHRRHREGGALPKASGRATSRASLAAAPLEQARDSFALFGISPEHLIAFVQDAAVRNAAMEATRPPTTRLLRGSG